MKDCHYSFRPLITSIFLALGLTPFGGEVFADDLLTSETRPTQVFTGNVVQNVHYAPQLNLAGFYGTNGGSYGEADLWLPIWQTWNSALYTDVRYEKDENLAWDIAVGAGYRWLSDDVERLYDIYGFYNSYNSNYNNQFQQVMGGGSVRTDNWTFRGNYYYSVGQTQYNVAGLNTFTLIQDPNGGDIQNNGLVSYGFENNYINGGVLEIGRTIPYSPGLSLFGGYYGFASSDTHPFINGGRARAEYRLDEAFNFKTTMARHITLEAMYQYDNVNLGTFTVGARVDIPLGKSYTNSKLQDAMMDYVRFYPHAVQEDTTGTTPVIYTQNGAPVIFDVVNNTADFETAAMDDSNVIVVNGSFDLDESVLLSSGKYVTGQNYEYSLGQFANLTGSSTIPTITGATSISGAPQWLLYVQNNNTVRDLNLQTQASTDGQALSYVITNYLGSVGNLTIDNITTNGAIGLYISDNNAPSVISITNSHFTPTTSIGVPSTPTTPIAIKVESGASATVSNVDNNIILFSTPGNTYLDGYAYQQGISLTTDGNAADNLTIGSVSGNTITFGDYVLGAGIYIDGNTGNQTIGNVDNNIISFGKYAGVSVANLLGDNAGGIVINNPSSSSGVQHITSVSGNTISFGDYATVSSACTSTCRLNGIYLNNQFNGTTQTIGSVDNNIISFGNYANATSGGVINGIWVGNNSAQTVTSINANKISFGNNATISDGGTTGVASMAGIYIFNFQGSDAQTITAVNDNSVTFGAGAMANGMTTNSNITLAGLYFNSYGTPTGNQSQNVASIAGNQITFAGATNASGSSSTTGVIGGFVFKNSTATATTSSFGLTNNSVSFEGQQGMAGTGTNINIFGISVSTTAGNTIDFTQFYGNSITLSNEATLSTAQLVNNGTMNITIGDHGISTLELANPGITFDESGNTINVTP